MMKVLLIGSNGLVGRNFIKSTSNIFSIDKIDKENSGDYVKLLHKYEYDFLVFTAQSEEYKNPNFTKDLFYVNIQYLFDVVNACVGRVRNIIFFSSGSVYKSSNAEIDENNPFDLESTNPYVISKISAELVLRPFQQKFNSITVLRPFFIYGPNQSEQMLIHSMIARIQHREDITLNNNEGLIFNPVFVRDVSRYLEQLIRNDAAGFFTYNIFGPERVTLAKIVAALASKLNIEPNIVKINEYPGKVVATSRYSIFHPKIGIDEGLKRTLDGKT